MPTSLVSTGVQFPDATTQTTAGVTPSGTATLTNKTISGANNTITNVSLSSSVTGTLPVANGGTGTSTAFTSGSVVFAGASGVYSQNNTNFFWDNTTSSLGIGTPTPVGKLHLNVSSGAIYYRISSGFNAMLMGGLAGASGEVSSNGDLVFGAGTSFAERGRYSSDGTFRVKGAGTAGSTDAFQVSGSAPASAVSLNSAGNFLVGGTAARATTAGSASIQLFNGTAPAGTLTNGVSLYSSSGDLNFMDSAGNGFRVGYRNLPPVGTKTASYTLAVGDVGKYVQLSTGGSIVIPTSTFAEGDAITLFNNTTGNITITCSAPTAYIAGTNTVKTSMTLATRGVATILFISATLCVVTGNVT